MTTEEIKEIVKRFNKEVIEEGNIVSFEELMHKDFKNHSTPEGAQGPEGMIHTFNNILRPAISNLKVTILEQVAENDIVTTRKEISGILTGTLLGAKPTNQPINIKVIDMVRIKDGKYYEHWGLNTLPMIIAQLEK